MSAAIFLGAILVVFGVNRFLRHDDASGLALAAAGAIVGGGLSVYLRAFIAKSSPGSS